MPVQPEQPTAKGPGDRRGLHQSRGGEVEELRAGDIVRAAADEWHWHGAAPDHFMTHLSITEAAGDERPETVWGEHVSDEEYAGPRPGDQLAR